MRFPTYPVKEGQLRTVPHLGEAWRVYFVLIALAADSPVDGEVGRAGVVAITRAQLAHLTGLAPSYVSTVLKRLVKEGMIGADSHRGRKTVYRVYPRWVPPIDSTALPSLRREVVLSGVDNSVDLSEEDNQLSSGADNFVSPMRVKEPDVALSREDNSPSKLSSPDRKTARRSHSTRARSGREDHTVSSVHDTSRGGANNTAVAGGAGVDPSVGTRVLGAHAPDATQEPLHPSSRANWDHEGKPTEAHWRALEDLTWRTYGIELDRSVLDWYDMDAWRTRMKVLTAEQAS